MIFLQPFILWGLLAISLPIIIHLFRFRRYKTIYFSDISALKLAKSETQKQSRIKHLLVLLSRILAIIMLVFAFAQPVIPDQSSQADVANRGQKHITVYLDNSLSMQIPGGGGMLLSEAKSQALEIARQYGPAERFRLVTNDFEASRNRFTDMESFISQVETTELSSVTRLFSDVWQRIQDVEAANQKIFVLSDFQKSVFDEEMAEPDSTADLTLISQQGAKPANLYIDSCWFENPTLQVNRNAKLKVQIRNSGTQDYENIPLTLKINGTQRAISSFSVPAGGKAEASLSFLNRETGYHEGVLHIEDSPITFDDYFYFSFNIRKQTRVLEIYDDKPSPFTERLFGRDSLIQFQSAERLKINYSQLPENHLIILNGLTSVPSGLQRTLEQTKNTSDIVLIPSDEQEVNRRLAGLFNIGQFAATDTGDFQVNTLSEKHMLFDNVFYERIDNSGDKKFDLPKVSRYYPVTPSAETDVIMRLDNGEPFLMHRRNASQHVYALTAPLKPEFTNLPRHPLFVPVFHRMAVVSQKTGTLYYLTDKEQTIPIDSDIKEESEVVVRLKKQDDGQESIPALIRNNNRLFIRPYVEEPGHYHLMQDTARIKVLAFNSDPLESELAVMSAQEIENWSESVFPEYANIFVNADTDDRRSVTKAGTGKELWRMFLWLTLFFVAVEVFLLRFLK